MKVLVVGSGLTGSLVTALLSQGPNLYKISIWEKARTIGGRTYTYQDPSSRLHVNMGAQYVSRHKNDHPNSEYSTLKDKLYDELLSNGLLVPLSGVMEGINEDHMGSIRHNYIAPRGFSSVPTYFLSNTEADLKINHNLTEVIVKQSKPDPSLPTIGCRCSCNSKLSYFNVVVLTMPAPDLLQVKGNLFEALDQETYAKVSSVTYAPRYALGLFFSKALPRTTWTYKYFAPDSNKDEDGDIIVRYASRGNATDNESMSSSLTVHSGVEFAAKHIRTGEEAVQKMMLQAVRSLIPDLPPPSHSKLVFWKYARANRMSAYHDTPGCLVLSHDPLVVATGDGLSDSNFESFVKAALTTVQTITAHISKTKSDPMI